MICDIFQDISNSSTSTHKLRLKVPPDIVSSSKMAPSNRRFVGVYCCAKYFTIRGGLPSSSVKW